ncbi:hypothetical protein BLA17378_04545 [Burkholderia aenigmatica]|uniref:XRE family transcriptional regulator n=1 Tax=Burkholderia aenigmatica TaxID=2015348 RepID=A0ABY6XVN4_9BURK|nr:helix-turn-helix transcriptional regulator [Burkholderia aenigmatica]VWC90597.1 hypothetical protein BLA17378_04545 [Burkholderia aenigmatica]
MVKQTLTDWQIADAARLKKLWDERRPEGMTQEKFGHDYDMGTQGNVYQYLRGKVKLNLYAAGQFAKMLRVTIDEISPTLADQVRDLYRHCDADRNRDFGISQETRQFIQKAIQDEIDRRGTKDV